jgi:hypothetical protein
MISSTANYFRPSLFWLFSRSLQLVTPNHTKAFDNYRSVLKAIVFHPKMGEMLTYVDSKSVAFNWHLQRKLLCKSYDAPQLLRI